MGKTEIFSADSESGENRGHRWMTPARRKGLLAPATSQFSSFPASCALCPVPPVCKLTRAGAVLGGVCMPLCACLWLSRWPAPVPVPVPVPVNNKQADKQTSRAQPAACERVPPATRAVGGCCVPSGNRKRTQEKGKRENENENEKEDEK